MVPCGGFRRKFFGVVDREVVGERQIRVVVSTGQPDRDGDILVQDGIDLDNFKRSRAILWNHDLACPVARCVDIGLKDGRLEATAEFPPAGISAKADEVFGLLKSGVINSASVGFRPVASSIEPADGKDPRRGVRIGASDLMEFSFVSIPSNPSAVVPQRSFGANGARKTTLRGIVNVIESALLKEFDPDQPRGPDGKWSGSGDDLGKDDLQHVQEACARDEDCAGLDHEVKLVLKGLAIAAGAELLVALLPEAAAGTVIAVGAKKAAWTVAEKLFGNAGWQAATHALKGMGVDTGSAEAVLDRINNLIKSAPDAHIKSAPDAHEAALLRRLVPKLRGAAVYAREVAVAKIRAERPDTPRELVDIVDQARDAYIDKLGALAQSGDTANAARAAAYRRLRDRGR